MTRVIRAAGGLVFRVTPKGRLKVLVAHRPRYDDWALPKGKLDGGETTKEAALREVLEETGCRCRIVASLPSTIHETGGKFKEVSWFAMRPLPDSPGFEPNDEIDRISWLSPRKAAKAVDYENDRRLIEGARLEKLARTGTLWVVRHAVAVDRGDWQRDDRRRPLSAKGKRQAKRIAGRLVERGIDRVVSSPAKRCRATVEPLARAIGGRVELDDRLATNVEVDDVRVLIDSLLGYNAVVCTHGEVMPLILDDLARRGAKVGADPEYPKGSVWRIDVDRGRLGKARFTGPA